MVSGLQSIDIALFRFINETIQNPVFDEIMPILSGGPWFLPLLFVGGTAIIWNGGARGRICVIMLAIVLTVGDAWITKRLKHAIGRPRPCITLHDVNLPMRLANPRVDDENAFHHGCSESGSMPSGHASYWFSGAMVAWIFYRRTWRFMLPLAFLVGFSRIYNGVHYPSDVLAGAIVGAGYGCAFVLGGDAIWRFISRRWFPLWASALPSLLPPFTGRAAPVRTAAMASASATSHWLRLGYVVTAALLVGRLIYIGSSRIELSGDEAVQWLWSKHLATGSESKPTLIVYLQWLGARLFGDTAFGARFFSSVFAAIVSLVALRFLAAQGHARAGFWLVAVLDVTPLLAVSSGLMIPESLLALFWSLALFSGWRAVQPDGTTKHWVITGIWMGLSFLSTPTALFQWLCWAVYFALWKPARLHLGRPGPYIAIVITALCALPVILWNQTQAAFSVAAFASHHGLKGMVTAIGSMHPMFFVAAVWAAIAIWKVPKPELEARSENALLQYFFAMGVPLLLASICFVPREHLRLAWIPASVVPFYCLMILYWDWRYRAGARHLRALLTIGLLLGALAVTLLHETDLVKKVTSVYLPPRVEPLRHVRGWKQMANIASRERQKLSAEGKPVFVLGGRSDTAALLSFYMPEAKAEITSATPLVYVPNSGQTNARLSFWPNYTTRQGENAIYIQEQDEPAPPPETITRQFTSVTEVGRYFILRRHRVLHSVQVFACRDLQP